MQPCLMVRARWSGAAELCESCLRDILCSSIGFCVVFSSESHYLCGGRWWCLPTVTFQCYP